MKPILTLTLLASACAMFIILVVEELGATLASAVTALPFWCYLALPIITFFASRKRSLKHAALSSAISAMLMISFYYCPWPSRRHFLHDLKRIQKGMSVEEVKAIMKTYHEGTGWPSVYGTPQSAGLLNDVGNGKQFRTTTNSAGELALQSSLVYRHDLGEADWGIIEIKSNRVTDVSFSPD